MLDNALNALQANPVFNCITQTIGQTPLVRLNRLPNLQGVEATILAKLEYFNPAGSIKDRAALSMLQDLLSRHGNKVKHIVEATSGNSGVACAWLGAIYDIPVTIVMPEHMSAERQKLIRHYGATLITTARAEGMPGAICHAEQLLHHIEGSVSMDQFANPANAAAHEKATAEELWQSTQGQIDALVACMGTGGTLTGLARTLKARNPAIHIVAAEPSACPLLSQGKAGEHAIQGINPGHIPKGLDRSLLDEVITVDCEQAIEMARLLACKEGMAAGISSGAATFAALQLGRRDAFKGKHIVTLLADGAERYFSTALFSA
ncbi:PLP-dependent cysteine synthase family protein [Alteromonas lipolytica]|uniref:cysteine synthase n=1 Tax=Alteromonas lipolytica TaxID=1856405 RepID=A0A1E8FCL6_9ALTE|nr:cysteine synthase [Alteromonas lipolytica]OFI33677.1 cysteine synthase A [Alteromonas lipolytica]GGF69420.1 cysteine synthase [Alteromonas lipolytica]